MPYVKDDDRRAVDDALSDVSEAVASAGMLNYAVTMLCLKYLAHVGTNYAGLNEVVGVLECAKQEFYRRACAPYEDVKIKENGDVYKGDAR